jgi:hypothetical protein
MKYIITESHYKLALYMNRVLNEEVDVTGYSKEDFIEAFLLFFRPWVKEKHGDEIGGSPLSYLVQKYLPEFCKDYDVENALNRYVFDAPSRIAEIGRELVMKGKHVLPTRRPQKKFTEQHKKGLETGLRMANFPDYIKLKITEDQPYSLRISVSVDFLNALKDTSIEGNPFSVVGQKLNGLNRYFTSFMGIKLGNPIQGGLEITNSYTIDGYDEWVKSVGRALKKELSQTYDGIYRQLKISYQGHQVNLKIGFSRYTNWSDKSVIKDFLSKKLISLGYNIRAFNIET